MLVTLEVHYLQDKIEFESQKIVENFEILRLDESTILRLQNFSYYKLEVTIDFTLLVVKSS